MRPTATDGAAWSVTLSVGHAKTTEPIEMPFGMWPCWPKEPRIRWGRDPESDSAGGSIGTVRTPTGVY